MAQVMQLASAGKDQAQARADEIRTRLDSLTENLDKIPELVIAAREAGDWDTLGYETWEAYVEQEFGTRLMKLDKRARRVWVSELKGAGMSTHEIAPVVNVDHATVVRDLSGADAPPQEKRDKFDVVTERLEKDISYLSGLTKFPETLTPDRAEQLAGLIGYGQRRTGLSGELRKFAERLANQYPHSAA